MAGGIPAHVRLPLTGGIISHLLCPATVNCWLWCGTNATKFPFERASKVNWLAESLLLLILQVLLRRVGPAKPRVDLKRNIQSEFAPVVNKGVRIIRSIDPDGLFLAPCVLVHAFGPVKDVLQPGQLTPRDLFELEGDRNPISENLAIRHSAYELEYSCCRIQNLQHMDAVAELRNLVKGL